MQQQHTKADLKTLPPREKEEVLFGALDLGVPPFYSLEGLLDRFAQERSIWR